MSISSFTCVRSLALRGRRKITSLIRPLLRATRSVARRSNTDVFCKPGLIQRFVKGRFGYLPISHPARRRRALYLGLHPLPGSPSAGCMWLCRWKPGTYPHLSMQKVLI